MLPEVQELLAKSDESWNKRQSALDQAIANVARLHETPVVKEDPPPPEKEEVDKAEMGRDGALAGVTGMQVQGIPIGQALVGGFAAVFVTELVDSFMPAQGNVVRGLVKLVVAGVGARWGKQLLGDTGAKAVTLLIAYDAIRDLIPFDLWAQRASKTVTGAVSNRGLVQGRTGLEQAEAVASNFSRGIFGR